MAQILLKKDYFENSTALIKAQDVTDLPELLKKLDHKGRTKEEIVQINRHIFSCMTLAQDLGGQFCIESKDEKIFISVAL